MTVEYDDAKLETNFFRYYDGHIGIRLVEDNGAPYCTASINMDELAEDEVAVKDYSENDGMLRALTRADIVEEPHRFIESGWVRIPICRLTEKAEGEL